MSGPGDLVKTICPLQLCYLQEYSDFADKHKPDFQPAGRIGIPSPGELV